MPFQERPHLSIWGFVRMSFRYRALFAKISQSEYAKACFIINEIDIAKLNLPPRCVKIIRFSSLAQPEVGAAYVTAGTLFLAGRRWNFMIFKIHFFKKKWLQGSRLWFELMRSKKKCRLFECLYGGKCIRTCKVLRKTVKNQAFSTEILKNDHVPRPSAIFLYKESCRGPLEECREKNRRDVSSLVL